jgi:hypothetical protein
MGNGNYHRQIGITMIRLYNADGSYTEQGNNFSWRMRHLVEELVADCVDHRGDLNDLMGILFREIQFPICKEIIQQKKKPNGMYYVKPQITTSAIIKPEVKKDKGENRDFVLSKEAASKDAWPDKFDIDTTECSDCGELIEAHNKDTLDCQARPLS